VWKRTSPTNLFWYQKTRSITLLCKVILAVCAQSIRDLDVIVDSGLTFDAYVNNVVSKAYARITMLFRGFSIHEILLCYAMHTERMFVLSLCFQCMESFSC